MKTFKDEYGAELCILVTCQRCKKQIIRRKIGIEEFEPMPKGWKINRDYDYYHYGWWCPDCVRNYTI